MTTTARYQALQWFADHEALGPDGVFSRKPPSARMRNLMAREGHVYRLPIGQFEYKKWRLTELGLEVLRKKPKRRNANENRASTPQPAVATVELQGPPDDKPRPRRIATAARR